MREFADQLKKLSHQVGMKISARGWCYIMEGFNLITKAQFDVVERLINGCRRNGILSIDFVAQEETRQFSGVEIPEERSPIVYVGGWLDGALHAERYYTPNWWKKEEYYIQMVTEKIDLKTMFEPVCEEFHIPIATGSGWQSMRQRAEYGRRFKKAEEAGLKCVLLYCGDFDPDGGRISDKLRKNLKDVMYIEWEDGWSGYDPQSLNIKRFGLDYDFIIANKLTWIDNLITSRKNADGSVRDLADPSHPNHHLPYVQDYLKKYGPRKCESNALIIKPKEGRALCQQKIEEYLGKDAKDRFRERREEVVRIVDEFRDRTGLNKAIQKAIDLIEEKEEK